MAAKHTLAILLCLLISPLGASAAPRKYDVGFSTYLGGNSFDAARDVCVDHAGNIIVVGGAASTDFPTTPGAYSRTLSSGGTSTGRLGACDAFIAKFSPSGRLIWSTYLGGPNYDRAYAVEVDSQDRIFVSGRAGEGFPTTPGSFQPNFIDTFPTNVQPSTNEYGKQNGFVACLTPEGQLVWASYVWYGMLSRDLAVDAHGDVYLTSGWNGNFAQPPAFPAGYKKTPSLPGGADEDKSAGDTCVLKVKGDGARILWGSWLCGSGDDFLESVLRLDAVGNVYFCCATSSADMPTNPADHGDHKFHGGKTDCYLAKLSPDGAKLIYGTYLGGSLVESLHTHQLAVDAQGNAYLALMTTSPDMPTTAGVFQPKFGGGCDGALCKVGPDGALLQCTYLGGSGIEYTEGVSVDAEGNVYITGATNSPNFPVAGTPYQPAYGPDATFDANATGSYNAYFTVVAPDFKSLVYSTYFGGRAFLVPTPPNTKKLNAKGGFHSSVLAPDGSFVAVGSWLTDGLPLVNAYQTSFKGGATPTDNGDANYTKHCDAVIVRFVPVPLGEQSKDGAALP